MSTLGIAILIILGSLVLIANLAGFVRTIRSL